MQRRMLSTAVASILLCAGGTALAQVAPPQATTRTTVTTTTATVTTPPGALDETAIKHAIGNAGYKEVKDLQFTNGVWEAKARGGNDNWVAIRIGPRTGKVYQEDAPSRLDQDEVKAKLSAQGYQDIHDVDYDDGLWSADATTSSGQDVDLLVDPNDGTVVASQQD